ncbi:hypothetical protein INR49_022781, partial [Caranx melampygus]
WPLSALTARNWTLDPSQLRTSPPAGPSTIPSSLGGKKEYRSHRLSPGNAQRATVTAGEPHTQLASVGPKQPGIEPPHPQDDTSTADVLVLCIVHGNSKPTEQKARVVHQEPLSRLPHLDNSNHDYDHEAFLGQDEAKTFEHLPPEESKRRLRRFVSEEELKFWIRHTQKKHVYDSVERQWSDFDINADGLISWDEYKNTTYGSYLDDPQTDTEYNYTLMMMRDERRFRAADVDRNLVADKEEFAAFFTLRITST